MLLCAPLRLQYTFTATPLNGGPPVVVTSSSPEVDFTGLTPATQVRPVLVMRMLLPGTAQSAGCPFLQWRLLPSCPAP